MSDKRPNLLLITCDEWRADFLDCYGGRGLVQTPHLDAFAQQAVVFDDAFAPSPICLPSRCALLSGQYPHRNGAYSNFRDRRPDPARPNLYNTLRAAGYRTAHIGKCHYTATPYQLARGDATLDREPVKDYTLSLGLDHLDLCNGKNNSLWFWNDYSRELEGAGLLASYRSANAEAQKRGKSFPFPGPAEWHPDWWCARKTIEHFARHEDGQPLFCWLSFPGPHYPHDPTPGYLDRVDCSRLPLLRSDPSEFAERDRIQFDAYHGKPGGGRGCEGMGGSTRGFKDLGEAEWIRIQHHYLANIALLDDAIGASIAAARERFGDDLIVLITADHGDCMGAHRLWAKNACGYHEVLRIPLLVQAPGFAPGRSDARVSLIDLFPTCCAWAGVDAPRERDGRPLQQSLVDGGHDLLLASMDRQIIIHDRRWKLVIDDALGLCELYDRESDPDEYHNLASDPRSAGVRQRLEQAALRSLMRATLG